MTQLTTNAKIAWLSLNDVLAAFHPLNPREHSLEEGGDILHIADSLLEVGFATTLTMQEGGYLLSGHGRSAAADFLRQQSEDWFDHRWDLWLSRSPERKAIAPLHKERFTASYWNKVPVTMVALDEATQKATLIRLNNQSKDGKDQPARLAAILSQLPKSQQEHAGWDSKTASSFISAFAERKQEREAEETETEEEDFQSKQFFSSPDSTDYSVGADDSADDSTEFSSDVDYDSEEDFDPDEPGEIAIAEVDSDVEDFKPDIFDHTKEYSETRAVLYLSNEELIEYKALLVKAAQKLEVDIVSNIAKIWRSQAIMALLRSFVSASEPEIEPISPEKGRE